MDPPGQLRVSVDGRWRPKDNFTPVGIVVIHPFGWTLSGVNNRYAVDLTRHPPSSAHPTGSDPPRILRIERVVDPAPIEEEEWDEWQAYLDAWLEQRRELYSRVQAREGVLLPNPRRPYFPEEPVKPYLRWPSFGMDGRIWLNRYAPSVKEPPGALPEPEPPASGPPPLPSITWTEQFHYDVFELDGTFLGTVEVPPGCRISTQEREYVGASAGTSSACRTCSGPSWWPRATYPDPRGDQPPILLGIALVVLFVAWCLFIRTEGTWVGCPGA
jgi:hypothetical protein